MFKLFLVIASVGFACAAISPEESKMYDLQGLILSSSKQVTPKEILEAVNELQENIYMLVDSELLTGQEIWVRDIVAKLYNIGKIGKERCDNLSGYNKDVELFQQKFHHLKYASDFVEFCSNSQNRMC